MRDDEANACGEAAMELTEAMGRILEERFCRDGMYDANAARAITSVFAATQVAILRGHLRDEGASQDAIDAEVDGFVAAFRATLAGLDAAIAENQRSESEIERARRRLRGRKGRRR